MFRCQTSVVVRRLDGTGLWVRNKIRWMRVRDRDNRDCGMGQVTHAQAHTRSSKQRDREGIARWRLAAWVHYVLLFWRNGESCKGAVRRFPSSSRPSRRPLCPAPIDPSTHRGNSSTTSRGTLSASPSARGLFLPGPRTTQPGRLSSAVRGGHSVLCRRLSDGQTPDFANDLLAQMPV